VLAVAVLAPGAVATRGGRAKTPPLVSGAWAGYALTHAGVAYTSVTGSWVEPAARCPARAGGTLAAFWLGLGGYPAGSQILAQIGTESDCSASDRPHYFAWFEVLPDIAHTVSARLYAGDTITSTVRMVAPTVVEMRLRDSTRHWTFTRRIAWYQPDTSSAEWIVEAPYTCAGIYCNRTSLANFGSVSIRGIAAVGNRTRGTLSDPAWTVTPLEYVPCVANPTIDSDGTPHYSLAHTQDGAEPAPISNDGSSARIAWVHDIGPPAACPIIPQSPLGGR